MKFEKLILSQHAIQRAGERFKVKKENAEGWYKKVLAESILAYTQTDGRSVMQHRLEDIFTVIDVDAGYVFTVIDKPAERVNIKSLYLGDFVASVEREFRKIQREHTKNLRAMEKTKAEALVAKGELMLNKLRVNNPKTQAAIEAKIKQADAEYEEAALRERVFLDAYYAAEVKLNSLLKTTAV